MLTTRSHNEQEKSEPPPPVSLFLVPLVMKLRSDVIILGISERLSRGAEVHNNRLALSRDVERTSVDPARYSLWDSDDVKAINVFHKPTGWSLMVYRISCGYTPHND